MIAFLGLLIWTGYALITNATRRPPAARSTPRSTSGCEARLHLAGLLAAEPHATAARRLELEREAAADQADRTAHGCHGLVQQVHLGPACLDPRERTAGPAGGRRGPRGVVGRPRAGGRPRPDPARLPASEIDPKPAGRCCAPAAAACKWCCGCSRTTPSTGYPATSTPTCATTTNTAPSPARRSSAAWPGVITYTPDAITVQLEEPGAPRVTRALRLLLDEINQAPPSLPGDPRPITYQLAARTSAFNS